MDFYKYISSKDVSNYLRNLHYEFNTEECLWLVTSCEDITLDEKIDALKYILTMPDKPVKSSEYADGITVHKLIHKYFNYVERIKKELKESDDEHIYIPFACIEDDAWSRIGYFKDYEDCIYGLKRYCERHKVTKTKITKQPFGRDLYGAIEACYCDKKLTSIHKLENCDPLNNVVCEWLYIDLPVPFQTGDILYDSIKQCPMVLAEAPANEVFPYGYYVSEDGKAIQKQTCEMLYTEFEFYREELEGANITLRAISEFIKNQRHSQR